MPSEGSIESKGVSREKGSEYKSLPVRVLPRDKTHRVYIDTYQSRCFIAVGSCCSRDWEVLQSDLLSVDWRSRKASAWFSLSQIRWDLGGGWRVEGVVQGPRTRGARVLRAGDVGVSAQAGSRFALPLPFGSAESLNYSGSWTRSWGDAWPHWWGQSSWRSLLMQP